MVLLRFVVPLLLPAALGQFVQTPTGFTTAKGFAGISVRYKEVPTGICELNPNVKSFSGYADVAEDQHIFWWFFEARNMDPTSAPLTVWINGGPGASSMIGLFEENGPCSIAEDGSVVNNPFSWNNISNMLYIDQPTQTGFSYSIPVPGYIDPVGGEIVTLPDNTCPDYAQAFGTCGTYSYPNETLTANSTANAAPNFWKTLQGFMGAFPQYSKNGFHFTSESYGGHYGPIFNEYILQQNAHLPPDAKEIRLESVSIGNGWYDPLVQYPAYYNFTVFPGNTYDYFPFNDSIASQMFTATFGAGNCIDKLKDCAATGLNEVCSDADNFCAGEVEFLLDSYANRDEYDIRELQPDPFPYTFYIDYLNDPKVQAAIGAFQNFSRSSDTVGETFATTGDDGREVGTIGAVRRLLQQGIRVMFYFGDADYNCNWLGGQVVADLVDAPGYSTAGFTNITISDGSFSGQVKQSSSFSFVRITESGHEVPFYQPLAALEIIQRAIAGKDIATGKKKVGPNYKTVGPAESTYREGNSTIQFEVLPSTATYNTTLNGPNPIGSLRRMVRPEARRLSQKPAIGMNRRMRRNKAIKRKEGV